MSSTSYVLKSGACGGCAGGAASGAKAANPWSLITSHSSTRIETAAIAPRFLQPHRSIVSLSNFHTEPRSRTKIDFICVSVTAGLRFESVQRPIIFYFNIISQYIDAPVRFYYYDKNEFESLYCKQTDGS